nr:hypothetical protein BaRGS_012005 [Batillaria attramentaria]
MHQKDKKKFRYQRLALPVTDFLSSHLATHGNARTLAACLTPMVTDTYLNLPHYLQCLVDFWWQCKNSSLKLVKVSLTVSKAIRLPARSVFSLMRRDPDLKVVYLVRDPRATLLSQRALFGHAPTPQEFCRMVSDDMAHMLLLQKIFPGRAVTVRYEDVAEDPLGEIESPTLGTESLSDPMNTRLASSTVTDRVIFSPLSAGTSIAKGVNSEKAARGSTVLSR